jgi:hypothetical protein
MYSETSVLIYQCTRRHIPCDGSLTIVLKQLSSPGIHGSSGAGTHAGDVLRLPSAEGRHVEQEVGVQQRVQAARVREERRAVGPREGLVKATKYSRNLADLGIALFSWGSYLIPTENGAPFSHFAIHCDFQDSNATVKPGLAETPTTQEGSCVSLLLCLTVGGKWQH